MAPLLPIVNATKALIDESDGGSAGNYQLMSPVALFVALKA